MTDKEKIKFWAKGRLFEIMNGIGGNDAKIILTDLFSFIDSMQEEPNTSVWHDAQIDPPQAKKKILATNEYGACEVDYAINMALYWPKVIKWAYIDDLLKL